MSDTKQPRYNDYSKEMPDLDFTYDDEYYPDDSDVPDPQVNPVLVGARVPIQKVGVNGVDLPIQFMRRDGTTQELHVKASLYASLDDPNAKGLNLSRFPILMHEMINPEMLRKYTKDQGKKLSIDVVKDLLVDIAKKQNSSNAYCKFRFSYPWVQDALRTRKELPDDVADDEVFKVAEGKKLSFDKAQGYIFYNCLLEGRYHDGDIKMFLTVDYQYSSTCPCSFTLSYTAKKGRRKAANAHSQRSLAKITVEFDVNNPIWIEDVVEMAREYVPTEVQVIVKRRDEMAQAERNGSCLMFTEDASRLLYEGLDVMYTAGRIKDFSVVTEHIESLHGFSATAVIYKGIPGGLC